MGKPTYEELEAQLSEVKAELHAKDESPADQANAAIVSKIADTEPAEEVSGEIVESDGAPTPPTPLAPTSLPADWPTKGYTGLQPWEVDEPPVLGHGHGLLIVGSAGDDVRTLCALLAYAGYQTSVSGGTNPLCIFDGSVKTAVESFRRDYGIQEDPGIVSASTPDVAGPWTWAALYRIARRRSA